MKDHYIFSGGGGVGWGGVGWGGVVGKLSLKLYKISTIIIVLFSDLFVMSQTCKLVLG